MNTPNDNQGDERDRDPLAERARELFDESVDKLDAATLSKLNQGRQAALEELSSRRRHAQWIRWMPATGVAAAAVVAVVIVSGPGPDGPPETQVVDDFEILISEDNLDMIEDLEFYAWLEAAEMDDTDNVG